MCATNLHNQWNLSESIESVEIQKDIDSQRKTGKPSQNQAAVKIHSIDLLRRGP
jgi:hypothetical protein